MNSPIIPQTYEQWHHCIVDLCKQPLSSAYIDDRIKALNDPNDYTTRKFVELYSNQQRLNTLHWFEQAKSKLKGDQ